MITTHDEVAGSKIVIHDPMLPDLIAQKKQLIAQYTDKIKRLTSSGKFEDIPYYEELINRHSEFIKNA